MKLLFTFIFTSLALTTTFAQKVFFSAEGSSTQVRLVWYPFEWPSNTNGVIIKRRTESDAPWVNVTKAPIRPEMTEETTLENNILDPEEREKIVKYKAKRIEQGKWKVMPAEEYHQMLVKGSQNSMLRYGFRDDFKLAAASGFALIDLPTGSKQWEYGVFFSEDQKTPTKTVAVKMESPTYELANKLNYKKKKFSSMIQLNGVWEIDSSSFINQFKLNGFSCFHQEENQERSEVLFGGVQPGSLSGSYGLTFLDGFASSTVKTTYWLKVLTIFGTSHEIGRAVFDPGTIPPDNLPLTTLPIDDEGYDLSKGLPPIKWKFDAENEKYIEGFVLMQDMGFADWEIVSDTIDKKKRTYIDPRKPINQSRYKLQIAAILIDDFGDVRSENDQYYYYKYVKKAAAPELHYEWIEKSSGKFLRIYWSENNKSPNALGYRLLYSYDGEEDSYRLPTDGRELDTPEYYYPIQSDYGEDYYFKVAQLTADDDEGVWSAPLKALSHTTTLPSPVILDHTIKDKTITLNWKNIWWPDIKDLKDVEVYVNGVLEQTLPYDATQVIYEYKKAGDYEFKIVTNTLFGVSAEATRTVVVKK